MRILQISSAASFGGGERYVADLTRSLAARGHDVYAVLRPNSPLLGHLKLNREKIKTLPLRNALDVREHYGLYFKEEVRKAFFMCVKRQDIIDVAAELFQENGYDRTTMRAIAKEAGVSVGNAYYYFSSKEQLVQGFYGRITELPNPRILFLIVAVEGADAAARSGLVRTVPIGQVNDEVFLNTFVVGWYPEMVQTREKLRRPHAAPERSGS